MDRYIICFYFLKFVFALSCHIHFCSFSVATFEIWSAFRLLVALMKERHSSEKRRHLSHFQLLVIIVAKLLPQLFPYRRKLSQRNIVFKQMWYIYLQVAKDDLDEMNAVTNILSYTSYRNISSYALRLSSTRQVTCSPNGCVR